MTKRNTHLTLENLPETEPGGLGCDLPEAEPGGLGCDAPETEPGGLGCGAPETEPGGLECDAPEAETGGRGCDAPETGQDGLRYGRPETEPDTLAEMAEVTERRLGGNLPFLLKPAGMEKVWGGTRLINDFNKSFESENLAETWECSTHKDGPSVAAGGFYDGRQLTEIIRLRPDYVGEHPVLTEDGGLPILVKLIDARQQLSVQVHPTDEYARKNENGQLGKTEMWYVLHAEKDAELIYGFSHDIDKETLERAIEEGTLAKYLQKVKVHSGDVFYMEAGTVHGIGAGIVLAEIQESSNLTYRLYDYDREDKFGKKRELHIKKALDVAILRGSARPMQPMRVLNYRPGWAEELLYRCKYFQVDRVLLNTECVRDMAKHKTDRNSFEALLCVGGCCTLIIEGADPLYIIKGDCVFVPAGSVALRLHGKAQFLRISC